MINLRPALSSTELEVLRLLIERSGSELETVRRDVLMSLITTERIAVLPRGDGYGITDVGLFDAGRPDLLMGNVTAVCSPATHRVAVCSDANRLMVVTFAFPGLWQTWRDMAVGALGRSSWYLTDGWKPVLEVQDSQDEPLTFIAPVRHIPDELMVWHVGRAWSGHKIEDQCPCQKAPCGLVVQWSSECVEHTRDHPIRQGHRAYQCPVR